MKSSRLAELQRQRELVREHLAWLDREIAAALGLGPEAAPPTPTSTRFVPAEARSSPSSPSIEPDPVSAAASARRGCFVAAAVVALLGGIALTTVYLVRYRDRPLFFVEQPTEVSRP